MTALYLSRPVLSLSSRPAPFIWLAADCFDGSSIFTDRLLRSRSSIGAKPQSVRCEAYYRGASGTLDAVCAYD